MKNHITSMRKIGENIMIHIKLVSIAVLFYLLFLSCAHIQYFYVPLNEKKGIEDNGEYAPNIKSIIKDENYKLLLFGDQFGNSNSLTLKLYAFNKSFSLNINELKIEDSKGISYNYEYMPHFGEERFGRFDSSQHYEWNIDRFDSSITRIHFNTPNYFDDELFLIVKIPDLHFEDNQIIKVPVIKLKLMEPTPETIKQRLELLETMYDSTKIGK